MTTSEILEKLCSANGVSGDEFSASETAAQLLRQYTEDVSVDAFGNVIANLGSPKKPRIMLDAHIDQIGMIVTHITDEGFVKVGSCGADRKLLLAQQVTIHGKEPVLGIIGTKPPHLTTAEETKKVPDVDEIEIDTGFTKAELETRIAPGDRVTFTGTHTPLLHGRVTSRSLDDRAGVAAILHALELLKEKELPYAVTVALSVQEEVGCRGASMTAYRVHPDEAIAVDVSFAKTQGVDKGTIANMGAGALIGIAPSLNRGLTDELVALAKEKEIPYFLEAMGGSTGTNADNIAVSVGGIRTGLISIPLKYMHTPVEVVQLSDVEAVGRLIAEYILR